MVDGEDRPIAREKQHALGKCIGETAERFRSHGRIMMRRAGWVGILLGCFWVSIAGSEPGTEGNFYARIRADDAPLGGRFTIVAYLLDSLDVSLPLPGAGRVLALQFRESNGQNAFVIPGDLVLTGLRETRWTGAFLPLGSERLGGLLPKDGSRWALWWVPQSDTLRWGAPRDLKLKYGFTESIFVPLKEKDARATLAALPWTEIEAARFDPEVQTGSPSLPDPTGFDSAPQVRERRNPEYPRFARFYDFEGTVHVVARVDVAGKVEDAYVLQSDALHELKVAALVAVMEWVFRPGRKEGVPVPGEVVIPILFSLGTVK
jgi:TonB family protein